MRKLLVLVMAMAVGAFFGWFLRTANDAKVYSRGPLSRSIHEYRSRVVENVLLDSAPTP